MFLSACIEWIFAAEYPDIIDRVKAAKTAGLPAVEFHLWRSKPFDLLASAVRKERMQVTSVVVEPRCHLVNAAARAGILEAVKDTIVIAKRLKAAAMVVASGPTMPGLDERQNERAIIDNLATVAPIVEAAGLRLLLEPLNTRVDHPGMFLDSTRRGLDIVQAVNSSAVRLLYDAYHSATMDERMDEVIGDRIDLVGHVQVADRPGRHEPGTGDIDWRKVMTTLRVLGYDGGIGLEFKPSRDSLASLEQAKLALAA